MSEQQSKRARAIQRGKRHHHQRLHHAKMRDTDEGAVEHYKRVQRRINEPRRTRARQSKGTYW